MADENINSVSGSNMPRPLDSREPKKKEMKRPKPKKDREQEQQDKKEEEDKHEKGNNPNLGRSVDVDG